MYLFAFAARRRLGGLVTLLCCAGIVLSLWAKPLAENQSVPIATTISLDHDTTILPDSA